MVKKKRWFRLLITIWLWGKRTYCQFDRNSEMRSLRVFRWPTKPLIHRKFQLIFFLFFALAEPIAVAQDEVSSWDPHPLSTADTSSPRDTLRSFNAHVSESMIAWRAGKTLEAIRGPALRAFDTFDFSQLPERELRAKEAVTALQLKEILDRIELPSYSEIPGDEEIAADDDALRSWTIPNTRITIAKMEKGPRAGEFLFSAKTVADMEQFYERAKHLPYKPDALIGIYEDYIHSPGALVPQSWARALPPWSKTVVFGQALWQWLTSALVLVIVMFAVYSIMRWGRRWDSRHVGSLERFGEPLSLVAAILLLYAGRLVLLHAVRFATGPAWLIVSSALWLLIFISAGWLVLVVTSRAASFINEIRHVKEGSIDGQLMRISLRLISLGILIALGLYAADFFGIPFAPLVAGIGVGGLAIALAIRPTLENIIGGLTLFADKPVRIGDYCRFGNDYGTVEEIGLRSTRLRKLDDTIVSIPNADFSQRELTNYTRRRQRLYQTTLGLRYETTPEQLRYVIAKLREMLLGHPKISPDMLHVRFHAFGAYSLDIELFAYVRATPWLEYRAVREDINLRIMDIVNAAGTSFAFPSQTAYLSRDSGLDAERGRRAEAEVQNWRSKGQLPFPEFDKSMREERADSLAYPPEGSPDYKPRNESSESS